MAYVTINKETNQVGSFKNLTKMCEVMGLTTHKMQYKFSQLKETDVQVGVVRIIRLDSNSQQTKKEVQSV